MNGYVLMSGYDGANGSPRRGFLYWPTTNTKWEANQLTRYEIRRRVHWLYGNTGIGRRCINGYARLVGFLTPVPDNADEQWNQEAFLHFMERAGSPTWFDKSGKFDFIEGQIQIERTAAKDGYILPVITDGPSGGIQLSFYESHQIVTPIHANDSWADGVLLDSAHKHLAYGVCNGADLELVQVIKAADALYYGRFESWGETHPLSILAAAVNNMIDIVEVRSDIKHAIKSTSLTGMVYEQNAQSPVSVAGGGFGNNLIQTQQPKSDGKTETITWEMVTSGGSVPTLPPGWTAKVIHDDRPGPNYMEFEEALMRDCCDSIDLPYGALFQAKGTSPAIRFTLEDIKRWIQVKHLHRARWCQRYYSIFIAREMKAGRLREPAGGDPRWWRCTWIGMADPTIDRGSKSHTINQLDAGLTTWSDEWGQSGAFWKGKVRQRIREVAFAKQEVLKAAKEEGVELTYDEVFRRQNQSLPPSVGNTRLTKSSGETDDEDLPDPPPDNDEE